MRLRYRFIVTLVVAIMGLASAGSTAYASTMGQGSKGNVQHVSQTQKSPGGWNRSWHDRDSHRDSHRDEHRDFHHDNHCCDHNNDHCCDNGGDFSNDCDWLRDHDHDAWLRECRN